MRKLTSDEKLTLRSMALEYRAALTHSDPIVCARVRAAVMQELAGELAGAGEAIGAVALSLLAREESSHIDGAMVPASEARQAAVALADGGPSGLGVRAWLDRFASGGPQGGAA